MDWTPTKSDHAGVSTERLRQQGSFHFVSFHQHYQIPLHYLHSLWFFKSSKLLDVEHQVSTIYKLHHKIKSILQWITTCWAYQSWVDTMSVCEVLTRVSLTFTAGGQLGLQPCKTFWTGLLCKKNFPLNGQIIPKSRSICLVPSRAPWNPRVQWAYNSW